MLAIRSGTLGKLLAPYASASALQAYRALREPDGVVERSWPGGSTGLLNFTGLGAAEAAILSTERLGMA